MKLAGRIACTGLLITALGCLVVACTSFGSSSDKPVDGAKDASVSDSNDPKDANAAADVLAVTEAGGRPRIFVTTQRFNGNLKLAGGGTSGESGADALCKAEAADAGLVGTFRAYLAGRSLAIKTPIFLTNGELAFSSDAELNSGPKRELAITARGEPTTLNDKPDPCPQVWTGYGVGASTECGAWDSTSGTGGAGSACELNNEYWRSHETKTCDSYFRLYCLEQ